jgi:hypothetical protein
MRALVTGLVFALGAGTLAAQNVDSALGYHLAASGDTLRILRGWETPITLAPLYQDGFRAGNAGVIRFVRDSRAKVTGFVLWAGRVRHLRFERYTASSRNP